MKKTTFFKLMMLFLAIGIASCSSNSTDDTGGGTPGGGTSNVVLSVNKTRVFQNDAVIFSVTRAGIDVTALATITVDGVTLTGPLALLSSLGDKIAVATIDGETSNNVTVKVIAPSYTTKMLIEDYTGTWCIWCPRMSKSIQDLHAGADGDRMIAIAIHNGSSMAFPLEAQMRQRFGVGGFPTGILNRDVEWNASSSNAMNLGQPRNYLNSVKPLGLAINSSLSGSTVSTTVKVGFDLDQTGTKLVAVLLENGRIASQANATSNYGGVNPIPNFVHNEILRANFTDIFGDVIPDADAVGGGEYTRTMSVAVPAGVNTANMEVVAFVLNASNKVVNVQRAPVGTNQPFD